MHARCFVAGSGDVLDVGPLIQMRLLLDARLSAQFEHMIGVTDTGAEVFTYSPAGLHKPPYAV